MQLAYLRQGALVLGGILVALLMAFLIGRLSPQQETGDSGPSLSQLIQGDMEDFFKAYWRTPIGLQGAVPASFTEREASLSPDACGECHPEQYRDWKQSLHSRAMGPGPWGQIADLTRTNPPEAILCMSCHAPLSEQMPLVASLTAGTEVSYVQNSHFDPQLQVRGITCASCHVRGHQRFGPPRREGAPRRYPAGMPNHGGVLRTPYFERAEFCRGCHQFDPENTVLVNGKPLQDTYREWKRSFWGRDGAACQECHMPGRRHLWQGIHYPEMVKNGVRVEARMKEAPTGPGSPLELEIKVTNAAVGHKFPTYVTPKVFVRAALLDGTGEVLPQSQRESIIGWDARFVGGQWKEFFDTRIPPGKSSLHRFRWTLPVRARRVRVWIEVYPDHFYHVYFYPAYLTGGNLSPKGRKLIERALQDSGHTSYTLFEKFFPLGRS